MDHSANLVQNFCFAVELFCCSIMWVVVLIALDLSLVKRMCRIDLDRKFEAGKMCNACFSL